ncbi:SixA phosphatase family protein [Nocardioides guangzhouensis]|uniref:SixA phosphatase family protein n=1 Tax=Nocardioides guangzhouensis TaxID=2497878 RepID=UPI001FE89E37|nr:histidine phosphatase family protein [Nocardioides guangzhouensis]
MNSVSRVLVIIRHAKAEPSAATDHERRLTDAGRADAGEAGDWLAGFGVVPDRVLVSSAARTRDTWESLAEGAAYAVEPVFDDSLYAAGPETALDLLRETSDEVTTLLVIGHNPTMAFLAQMLEDGEGDAGASSAMAEGFPTTAVAVLAHDGSWAELEMSGATLRAFHVGRG